MHEKLETHTAQEKPKLGKRLEMANDAAAGKPGHEAGAAAT